MTTAVSRYSSLNLNHYHTMKKIYLLLAIHFVLGVNLLFSQSDVYIDFSQKGAEVKKSMYGIFFEEISHSGDGGLYAELIQNRGFEEHVLPSGTTLRDGKVYFPESPNYIDGTNKNFNFAWDINALKFTGWTLSKTKCTAQMDVVNTNPLHSNTPHSLQIDISDMQSGGRVMLKNSGYWGIAVKKDEKYNLRFYLRSSANVGNITAKIVNGSTIYAQQNFAIKNTGNWEEYTAVLTSNVSGSCNFQIELNTDGTVWIDYVSLFPANTFKGRENGLRSDIAQTLADLKPAFIRWPGGCIVEGISMENRIKWKETIGDPMTRRGEYNLWGYRSTMGFGYHEFLQYCEDIDADAMFVANVGLSCRLRNGDFVSDSELPALIQEIRDAIDYATAGAGNEWGAKRIAAGHPEPFPLKYVELGNENWGPRYIKNYNLFFNTLKPEYPEITFISTLGVDADNKEMEGGDMVDPHYYRNVDWFYDNSGLFDAIKRDRFTAYVGEYACNQGVGAGNMSAALSEAAFMTGMERNSDLVTMTSYAPLIENSNKRSWATNMIWLNDEKVVGRTSYYVQQMYGTNRPDYNLPTQLVTSEMKPAFQGRVGLGTWQTAAEFKDFKVTKTDKSSIFYEADFVKKQSEWTPFAGVWSVDGGAYKQTDLGNRRTSFLTQWSFNDCVIDVKARKISGKEGFLVIFGGETEGFDNYYQLTVAGWGNTKTALEKVVNGTGQALGESTSTPHSVEVGKWYDIKIVLTGGSKIECFVDGEYIIGANMNLTNRIQTIAGYDETTGETIIKIVNGESSAQNLNFTLNSSNVEAKGKVITLSATNLTDENSFAAPTAIVPVETEYTGFSNKFSYSVKPYSFTILRIKSDKTASGNITVPSWYLDSPIDLQGSGIKKKIEDELSFTQTAQNYWLISHPSKRIKEVSVTNMQGAKILNKQIDSTSCNLEMKAFPTGVYLVEITMSEGQKIVEKIINQ